MKKPMLASIAIPPTDAPTPMPAAAPAERPGSLSSCFSVASEPADSAGLEVAAVVILVVSGSVSVSVGGDEVVAALVAVVFVVTEAGL